MKWQIKGYKIFDINPSLISEDIEGNFSFVNCALRNSRLLNTLDVSLAQRVRGRRLDVVLPGNQSVIAGEWMPVGAILASGEHSLLRLDLSERLRCRVGSFFRKGEDPLIKSYRREDSETVFSKLDMWLRILIVYYW